MAAKPKREETEWQLAPGFRASWKKFKSDALNEAMTTFNDCKRATPARALPRGMKDHKLSGPLKDFWECHLEGNTLLLYKPLPGGAIKLVRVCDHDGIAGPKGKALAASLKKEDLR
jgi:addiction module RelE/StbE family toxin